MYSYEQGKNWKQFLFSSGCAGIPGGTLPRLLDTFILNFLNAELWKSFLSVCKWYITCGNHCYIKTERRIQKKSEVLQKTGLSTELTTGLSQCSLCVLPIPALCHPAVCNIWVVFGRWLVDPTGKTVVLFTLSFFCFRGLFFSIWL